jgi:hypothetical protein
MEAFNDFTKSRDKFESQYTVVIYNTTREDAIEAASHQMRILEKIGDTVKRAYLVHKMWVLRSHLEKRVVVEGMAQPLVASVFLLDAGDALHEIPLAPEWIATLRKWNVPTWICRHGEYFDIPYLTDLFLNTAGTHTVHVHNNKLTHWLVTPSKRQQLYQEETKGLDLAAYFGVDGAARKHWTPGTRVIVHGVSVVLKNYKPGVDQLVVARHLRDEEVDEIVEREAAADVHRELAEWMGSITNPKLVGRLVFGANIRKRVQGAELKTLYASEAVAAKIREKCSVDQLRTFDMKVVRSLVAGDAGARLEREFDGALGVTYY